MNKKERAKGFVAGVLLTILLTSSVAVLANTSILEVVFSVNHVVVNGNRLELSEEERPFTFGGRTFLPARAIAEAVGQPVEWDGSTGTIYIGSRTGSAFLPPAPIPVALMEVVPPFERTNTMRTQTINMSGNPFVNAITSTGVAGALSGNQAHNLDGRFHTLTATIGRIDGSQASNIATISFIGDGRTLAAFNITRDDVPQDIFVDVTGVSILRIQLDTTNMGLRIAVADMMIE